MLFWMGETRRAVMCYVSCDDRTLMIDRNRPGDFLGGTYVALGGGINDGERPIDAVHREIWEESRMSVFNIRYRGTVLFKHLKKAVNADNKKNHSVDIYSTDLFYRHGPMWECESGSLVWAPNSKIAELAGWNGNDLVHKWLKDGRIFDAEVIHGVGGVESFDMEWISKCAVSNNPYRVD